MSPSLGLLTVGVNFSLLPHTRHRRPELPYLSSSGSNGFHEKDPAVSCGESPSDPQSCPESRHPMRSMDSPRTRATIERRNRGSVPSGCADIKRRDLNMRTGLTTSSMSPCPFRYSLHIRGNPRKSVLGRLWQVPDNFVIPPVGGICQRPTRNCRGQGFSERPYFISPSLTSLSHPH